MDEQRKIIHIDADAFYASVEMRDNPELSDIPIAVGGRPNSRGVIATCNYLARGYGIRSAMPSAQAAKLCPKLVFIPPDFQKYKEASAQLREIMEQFTHIIEPLSLDEAYLDVTECDQFSGSATLIAQQIKRLAKEQVGITVSAGIAPNKFLAKVASDWNKPDGIFTVTPETLSQFVLDLPVGKISGVGKVTTEKLQNLGIYTCGDLQKLDRSELIQHFGKYGERLYHYARGVDKRPVQTSRERKSLSIEHTYSQDINSPEKVEELAAQLYRDLLVRAQKLPGNTLINKRQVKVKFADFTQTTLEESFHPTCTEWRDEAAFTRMIFKARQRESKAIRLMGMGVKLFPQQQFDGYQQLPLF